MFYPSGTHLPGLTWKKAVKRLCVCVTLEKYQRDRQTDRWTDEQTRDQIRDHTFPLSAMDTSSVKINYMQGHICQTRHTASAGILTLIFHIRRVCCHTNETCAPITNPPNSAQLGGTPCHSPNLLPCTCSSVGMRRGTDSHTDGRGYNTFRLAMPNAKCNNSVYRLLL